MNFSSPGQRKSPKCSKLFHVAGNIIRITCCVHSRITTPEWKVSCTFVFVKSIGTIWDRHNKLGIRQSQQKLDQPFHQSISTSKPAMLTWTAVVILDIKTWRRKITVLNYFLNEALLTTFCFIWSTSTIFFSIPDQWAKYTLITTLEFVLALNVSFYMISSMIIQLQLIIRPQTQQETLHVLFA